MPNQNFLGIFEANSDIVLDITWTTADSSLVSGASLSLIPPAGPAAGTNHIGIADGTTPNKFRATVNANATGTWTAVWTTTPPGGQSVAQFYVQ